MAWGPWVPYTQTSNGDFPGVIAGGVFAPREVAAILSGPALFPFGPDITADGAVRKCCMQHAIVSAPMNAIWTGACPTLTPGGSNYNPIEPSSPGIVVEWSYAVYKVRARQESLKVYADTTLSHGMPSWQDPDNDSAPPQFEYDPAIDGLREYEYQPFTSLDGEMSFPNPVGAVNAHAEVPFEVHAFQVPFTQDQWNDGGSGAVMFSLSVSAAGGSVIPLGSQILTDLIAGYRWDIVASCQLAGFFFDNDPGLPASGSLEIYCPAYPVGTYRRYGMRRQRIPDITPPLQQRQRGDGLGGGPPRSGLGQNARGGGLFARGVF